MSAIFGNLKAVEVGGGVAAPYCAKLFADLGAETIKIEPPGCGDPVRSAGPFPGDSPDPECSGLFHFLNTNKFGITLDPSKPTGRALLRHLLRNADILIESEKPGTLASWGLPPQDLLAENPGLVIVSITPFGQTGPYRDYAATDMTLWHFSSLGMQTFTRSYAYEEDPPWSVPGYQASFASAVAAASAALAALFQRHRTGRGQHIDVSMQEALVSTNRSDFSTYSIEGMVWPRKEVALANALTCLPCKDGYVSMVINEQHQWESFLKLLGSPEWSKEEIFRDNEKRRLYMDALVPLVLEWTMQHTKEEIYRAGQAQRVAVFPVYTIEEVTNYPQLEAREAWQSLSIAPGKAYRGPALPYRNGVRPLSAWLAAPRLGQHNELVFCGRLGVSREELVILREGRTI